MPKTNGPKKRRKGTNGSGKAVALPMEVLSDIPFKYSDRLYLEILSRWSGQGPLVGHELGQAVDLLAEAHRKTTAYAYKNCLIATGFDGKDFVYCGRPCNPRNHTIQKNGVLSIIAVQRGNDPRVLRMTPKPKPKWNLHRNRIGQRCQHRHSGVRRNPGNSAECTFLDTGVSRCDEGFCSFRLRNPTHCRLPKRTLGFS